MDIGKHVTEPACFTILRFMEAIHVGIKRNHVKFHLRFRKIAPFCSVANSKQEF